MRKGLEITAATRLAIGPGLARIQPCEPIAGRSRRWTAHAVRVSVVSKSASVGVAGAAVVGGYLGLVTGAVPIDLGVGRRTRPLGPFGVDVDAPREVVFDVVAEPYLGRQTHAMADKIRILERGSDMVLAAHRTALRGRLVAVTLETVRFTRPDLVDFRLTRGPVPYVTEQFLLTDGSGYTRLDYTGELGTDLWALGTRWGNVVAGPWQRSVRATFTAVKAEAERRAAHR